MGLADTFYVSRLGDVSLAALGVATSLLSSFFWIFNFLGIGTQTAVAKADGEGQPLRAAEASVLATRLSLVLGVGLALAVWPFQDLLAQAMGTSGAMSSATIAYLRVRLLGAPATLLVIACFGALRGLRDMRTPLRIALITNLLNAGLDPILIFGAGPFAAGGVAGAAWASTVSQWLAALLAWRAVRRRFGILGSPRWKAALELMLVGRDLVLRTGLLLLFLVVATRVAPRAGAASGAAHQVVRQVWILTALLLDAYAASAQSLIGFYVGMGKREGARWVAFVALEWGVATGLALAAAMMGLEGVLRAWFVPPESRLLFSLAWPVAALAQPLSALSFVTDGVHWGTGDYRYLRNAMFTASGFGLISLLTLDPAREGTLERIWWITLLWLAIRSLFGVARIWPAPGGSPFRAKHALPDASAAENPRGG